MSDIVLFYPYIESEMSAPPLGLLYLTAFLEENDYRIKVIDENTDQYNLGNILTGDTLFVGISSMTGPQLLSALDIARRVRKQNPNIPIVWGGVHASLMPIQTISHKLVDIVVEGEGEKTVLELAGALKNKRNLRDIAGIYFKEHSGRVHYTGPRTYLDVNDLPFPAWSHIEHNFDAYMTKRDGRMMVQFSRGCPFRCSFCYNRTFNKSNFRSKTPERIIEELEYLIKKYNIRKFDICDDNFITYKKSFHDFADKIDRSKLDVDLQLSVRLNYIDRKIIESLRKARVSKVFIGMESGSQKIVDEIKKDIKTDKIKHAVEQLTESHIIGFYSFMFNFPFETMEDLARTKEVAEFIWNKDKKSIIILQNYCPYPGTDLYERMINQFGFKEPKALEEWGSLAWQWGSLAWHKPANLFDSNFSFGFVNAFLLMWKIHFSRMYFRRGLIKKWINFRFRNDYNNSLLEIRMMAWLIAVARSLIKKVKH